MTLTAEEVVDANHRQTAIRLFYILIGKAIPQFPNTTRSHPSPEVHVCLLQGDLIREGDRVMFPWHMGWDLWERGFKPVVLDPTLQRTIANNRERLHIRDYEDYISNVLGVLKRNLVEEGFLPPSENVC